MYRHVRLWNGVQKRGQGDTHEVLDLLVQHSTSASGSAGSPAANHVHVLRTVTPWSGQFCTDATIGEAVASNVQSGTATALTDHNAVTASFTLPGASSASAAGAGAAVDTVVSAWSGQVALAACGQTDISCAVDSNCCNADYSWTRVEQHCNAFKCEDCQGEGSSCSIQFEGSSCCGYDDYSSGNGLHCESNIWDFSMTCIKKFNSGASCSWDEECNSGSCDIGWVGSWYWGWWQWRCA